MSKRYYDSPIDAIKVKPFDELSIGKEIKCNCADKTIKTIQKTKKCQNARCGSSCDIMTLERYGNKPDECPEFKYAPALYEMKDAFDAVGIHIREKINRLCNEGQFEEAIELEKALNIINKYDYIK